MLTVCVPNIAYPYMNCWRPKDDTPYDVYSAASGKKEVPAKLWRRMLSWHGVAITGGTLLTLFLTGIYPYLATLLPRCLAAVEGHHRG